MARPRKQAPKPSPAAVTDDESLLVRDEPEVSTTTKTKSRKVATKSAGGKKSSKKDVEELETEEMEQVVVEKTTTSKAKKGKKNATAVAVTTSTAAEDDVAELAEEPVAAPSKKGKKRAAPKDDDVSDKPNKSRKTAKSSHAKTAVTALTEEEDEDVELLDKERKGAKPAKSNKKKEKVTSAEKEKEKEKEVVEVEVQQEKSKKDLMEVDSTEPKSKKVVVEDEEEEEKPTKKAKRTVRIGVPEKQSTSTSATTTITAATATTTTTSTTEPESEAASQPTPPRKSIVSAILQRTRNNATTVDLEIPLPLADTPMIEKNRRMRISHDRSSKGRRRSSFDTRGKRVSSLGPGLCHEPHEDVATGDLYRHISPELSDPLRMKQLLIWLAQRSIRESWGTKSLKREDLELVTQVKKEVIQDLQSGKINTSWYHRRVEENENEPSVVLPHPHNVLNAETKVRYEGEIERYRAEVKEWEGMLGELVKERDELRRVLEESGSNSEESIQKDVGKEVGSVLEEGEELVKKVEAGKRALDAVVDGVAWKQVLEKVEMNSMYESQLLAQTNTFTTVAKNYSEVLFNKMNQAYEEVDAKIPQTEPLDVLRALAAAAK